MYHDHHEHITVVIRHIHLSIHAFVCCNQIRCCCRKVDVLRATTIIGTNLTIDVLRSCMRLMNEINHLTVVLLGSGDGMGIVINQRVARFTCTTTRWLQTGLLFELLFECVCGLHNSLSNHGICGIARNQLPHKSIKRLAH